MTTERPRGSGNIHTTASSLLKQPYKQKLCCRPCHSIETRQCGPALQYAAANHRSGKSKGPDGKGRVDGSASAVQRRHHGVSKVQRSIAADQVARNGPTASIRSEAELTITAQRNPARCNLPIRHGRTYRLQRVLVCKPIS